MAKLRLGTRASALARWQAHWVADQLSARGIEVELVPIATRGDVAGAEAIADIGSPGVFTKELQRALLDREIDLAVHSLKDLPTDEVPGLVLAAVPPRESTEDALVSRAGHTLATLPEGARVGTGSLRRRAQLLHLRSDLEMRDIRGNVDTRLKKLDDGQYDALVLAQAGLKRLGMSQRITQILDSGIMLPAVGQGALGMEARSDDAITLAALAQLDDAASHLAVRAERALLAALSGGCLAPIGAWARWQADGLLRLDAVVLSADGRRRIAGGACGSGDDPIRLGTEVAAQLNAQGAGELIQQARRPV